MNDTMDKMMDTAGQLAGSAVKATTRLVQKGREKAEQASLNARLAKLYRQLGALVYSQNKNDNPNQPMVDWYVAEIDKIKAKLAAYAAPAVDNVTVFGGEGVQEDAMFCGGNGAQPAE